MHNKIIVEHQLGLVVIVHDASSHLVTDDVFGCTTCEMQAALLRPQTHVVPSTLRSAVGTFRSSRIAPRRFRRQTHSPALRQKRAIVHPRPTPARQPIGANVVPDRRPSPATSTAVESAGLPATQTHRPTGATLASVPKSPDSPHIISRRKCSGR